MTTLAAQGSKRGWYSVLVILFLLNLYIVSTGTNLLNPPSGGAVTLGQQEEASINRGNLLVQLTGVSLALIGLFITGWRKLGLAGKQNKLALTYVLFLILGLVYSQNPE